MSRLEAFTERRLAPRNQVRRLDWSRLAALGLGLTISAAFWWLLVRQLFSA
jgi:hypothetical protein